MFEELFAERGLSLERLRTFCEIAEAGGVTRAAKGVVRQSQYSRQLRELETYLGAELFVRKRNSFKPTAAGTKLLNVAKEFMSALEATRREIKGMPQAISIGAGESIFNWLLFPRLPKVQSLFPSHRFEFRNMRSEEVVRGLLESDLDFGIVREDACPKELNQRRLGKISYCLYVPASLAKRLNHRDDLAALGGLPLATLEGDGQFKTRLLELTARHEIHLDMRMVCSSFPLMTEILKRGQVAAILPSIAEAELPEADFERVRLKLLKSMDRMYVVAFKQRTLDRRESVARQLKALVEVLQVQEGC